MMQKLRMLSVSFWSARSCSIDTAGIQAKAADGCYRLLLPEGWLPTPVASGVPGLSRCSWRRDQTKTGEGGESPGDGGRSEGAYLVADVLVLDGLAQGLQHLVLGLLDRLLLDLLLL